ncbi:hypothetical protein JWG40_19635 [Leptospira sp. 201903074]|uniref:hypothetical protein n=1 Tax=Leptospira abararensis TaxID=2810036 RepID=UPI00196492E2|nr:hypothetical protein [Leptospira abararensis]MBM9549244.1 hypothetical protein [Leptospira abararensis]
MEINKLTKIFFLLTFSLCLAFCGKPYSKPRGSSQDLVVCSKMSDHPRYKKGCIPFGERHFCSLLAESIKSKTFLNFMTGVWLDDNDPQSGFIYKIDSSGTIIQYDDSTVSGTWKEISQPNYKFAKAKISRKGSIILLEDKMKLEGIWVYGEDIGKFIANKTKIKIECFVGMPDQIAVRIIPEIGFRPYTEIYYEPINVEIEYPSGKMRVIE